MMNSGRVNNNSQLAPDSKSRRLKLLSIYIKLS